MARLDAVAMSLRIKQLRQEKGWTQEHLADLARMSRSQLAMIERETRPANTLRLNAIAAALGVSTEHLFAGDGLDSQMMTLLRKLTPQDKAILLQLAESLAAKSVSS
jgi:transcriptional regulator with XRE-family HTH domain